MPETIKGGSNGNICEVDTFGNLQTWGVNIPEISHHTQHGHNFWIASDFVSLTTAAGFSGVFYLKNTHATRIIAMGFLRTCNDQVCQWKTFTNPTGGTLISGGTATTAYNANVSSGKTLSATVLGGADGQTVTGGSQVGQWINNTGHSLQWFDGSVILGPGDSIAVTAKPAADATVCVTAMCWQVEA